MKIICFNLLSPIFIGVLFFISIGPVEAQVRRDTCRLVVNISELSSDEGEVVVSLHEPGNMFPSYSVIKQKTAKILDGKSTIEFMVMRKKYYAVTVHHDSNKNGKMDTSILGKPIETYLVSNGAVEFNGMPRYEDARFQINHNPTIIEIVED